MRAGAKSPLRKITLPHGLRRTRRANRSGRTLEHAGGCPVLERLLSWLSSNGPGSGVKNNCDETVEAQRKSATADGRGRSCAQCEGKNGSQGWIRTTDLTGNNRPLYQLSYRGIDAISSSAVRLVQYLQQSACQSRNEARAHLLISPHPLNNGVTANRAPRSA